MATLANRTALLKLIGVERPIRVKLHLLNSDGALVFDKNLASQLKALAEKEGEEDFFGNEPLIFFPHCRIEWILTKYE
jgi:hypothetical protein